MKLRLLVMLVLLATGSLAWLDGGRAASAATDDDDASLIGSVQFTDGTPVEGAVVDLFEANPDGSRATFLGDIRTDGIGMFALSVPAGCYVLTYIAPNGELFVGGSRYHQIEVCVAAGELRDGLDAHLSSPAGDSTIGGVVRFSDGTPVEGVVVDYFDANPDGSRGRFIGDTQTDETGTFSRPVGPGCYVLTYIAPDGELFVGGSRYFHADVCVRIAEAVTDLDAYLSSPEHDSAIDGTVRFADGEPVEGLKVDYFEANDNRTRARFLGSVKTDGSGNYRRAVMPGCHVLVFIAPPGTTFEPTGNYSEVHVCVEAQETATVDAELTALDDPCVVDGQVITTPLTGQICEALLLLYAATDGPNWIDNEGWATPTDPCTWSGLECSGTKLRHVELARNGLAGPIPPELGRLIDLTALTLLQNELTGPIPPELGELHHLAFLRLSGNQLTGPIPPGVVQLPLFELSLHNNRLSGPIPPELGRSGAIFVYLSGNELSGSIPPELGGMRALDLTLNSNDLSGPIPPELGQLSSIASLGLARNRLSGPIPEELGQLVTLTGLGLESNELTGSLPASLGQLAALRHLDVSDNQLTGDVTGAMDGLRSHATITNLRLSDGPGRNSCFTVTDPTLADWIASFDPGWAECETGE